MAVAGAGLETQAETDTLVVGAGPAGLAIGACLARRGVPFEIWEREGTVGAAWRKHYDRLHLHTARDHSALPYTPFSKALPRYVPRADVVAYLEAYATEHGLAPRFGEEVVAVRRAGGQVGGAGAGAGGGGKGTGSGEGAGAGGGGNGDGFEVASRGGRRARARRVVVATGYNRAPVEPRWPGQERFKGEVLHSARYRNGASFKGKHVLVVGIGNTGGEIAIDLHEHGARPAISIRSPVVVLPREFLGTPTQVTGILTAKLPIWLADRIAGLVSWIVFGDLRPIGFGRPAEGAASMVARGRIPLIDVGTIDLVRKGAIAVLPDVERFEEEGVAFKGGERRPFDAVVLATGYRPRLEDFLEAAPRVTNAQGYPLGLDAAPEEPGLYFLGFVNPGPTRRSSTASGRSSSPTPPIGARSTRRRHTRRASAAWSS